MQTFVLARPATLEQATALLDAEPGARVLAGGTDLIPNLRHGIEQPTTLIDLSLVAGFAEMGIDRHGLVLGAGMRLGRLCQDALVVRHFRALAEAALAVGAPAHRSAATLGGNLCLDTRCVFYNQSAWWRAANLFCLKRGGSTCHVAPQGAHCHAAYSGDLAPALLVLEAQVEVVSVRGTRCIPLAQLYRDDGAAHLQLARDELVARVQLPTPQEPSVSGYRKARVRGAIDFPLAGVAIALAVHDGAVSHLRVALTGVSSRPLLLEGTQDLLGQPVDDRSARALDRLVQKQVSPMRTTVTAANHRRLAAAALAQRLLRELADQCRPESAP
jgi:4-hydroxybenzoyl-CoA reductase subunit beta